jgi:thymidylate kinase
MNDHRHQGALVCVEGIDGAGKTTAVAGAAELLRQRGVPTVLVDKHYLTAGSAYARRHLRALAELIWAHPADDPYLEFGDLHWVQLQASWYAGISRCVIDPLIDEGHLVLTDTWTYKFLAKLSLRPEVDLGRVKVAFADTRPENLAIYLEVTPEVAASRKGRYSISESGNHEGTVDLTARGFIAYQRQLSEVLDRWAAREGWRRIDANTGTPEQVAERVADEITTWLSSRHHEATTVHLAKAGSGVGTGSERRER